jgi:hypothetical protein
MQFNQFLIEKMAMLKNANFASKNPDVVGYSHLAALGKAAASQRFFKSLIVRVGRHFAIDRCAISKTYYILSSVLDA